MSRLEVAFIPAPGAGLLAICYDMLLWTSPLRYGELGASKKDPDLYISLDHLFLEGRGAWHYVRKDYTGGS
jgi:hypothetical protein